VRGEMVIGGGIHRIAWAACMEHAMLRVKRLRDADGDVPLLTENKDDE